MPTSRIPSSRIVSVLGLLVLAACSSTPATDQSGTAAPDAGATPARPPANTDPPAGEDTSGGDTSGSTPDPGATDDAGAPDPGAGSGAGTGAGSGSGAGGTTDAGGATSGDGGRTPPPPPPSPPPGPGPGPAADAGAVTCPGSMEAEPNNLAANAMAITQGTYCGSIGGADAADHFKVMKPTTSGEQLFWGVRALDSANVSLDQTETSDAVIIKLTADRPTRYLFKLANQRVTTIP